MLNRRNFISSLAGGSLSLSRLLGAGSKPPNILYIMADDHSAQAISCYGSTRNKTPNIDRIAAGGVRMTNCLCVDSICTPSRGAILTGKYGHITGVRNLNDRLDPRIMTFPQLLHNAGYQTGLVGKYHLSSGDIQNPPQGFDYWSIFPGQGKYFDPMMFEMGKERKFSGYATDIITDLSLEFLKKRDRQRPFLMQCHHKAPHGLWEYDQKHASMYTGEVQEPGNFRDDYKNRSSAPAKNEFNFHNQAERMEKNWPTGRLDTTGMNEEQKKTASYQKFIRDYMRCVAAVDDNVGRLLEYLDSEDLSRNTIVIYTSDQGAFTGEHGFYDKRFFYEESIHMPFLARYPNVIPKGKVNGDMVLNIDFAPTLLDFAGLKAPADMQGRSFRPVLSGQTPANWRKAMFYVYYMNTALPPHYGVRSDRYKLIRFPITDEWELFDLKEDPHEMNSVYGKPAYANVAADMKQELERLKRELKIPEGELPSPENVDRQRKQRKK